MEPAQSFRDLLDAMQAGDFTLARELAEALRTRLAQGGLWLPGHSLESAEAYLDSVSRRIDRIPSSA